MEEKEHKKRHVELHSSLEELVSDFFKTKRFLLSKTPVVELLNWSEEQAIKPTHAVALNKKQKYWH